MCSNAPNNQRVIKYRKKGLRVLANSVGESKRSSEVLVKDGTSCEHFKANVMQ